MWEDLNIAPEYDGFIFLAEAMRNPPVLRPHQHVELELNLVVEGEVTYVHDNQRYCFSKGSLLWLFPQQEHQLIDRMADAAYYVAVFTPAMLKQACRGERYDQLKQQQLSKSGILHTELRPAEFESLRGEMAELVEEGLDSDLLNREAGFGQSAGFQFQHNDPDWMNAGLRRILLASWRLQSGQRRGRREVSLHPVVRQALNLIGQPDGPGDLVGLADSVGVSPAHLSRTFRRELGVSLSRYRNSIRLGRFWEIYRRAQNESLLNIVLRAGFGSYAQFYRVYVAAYGRNPRGSLQTADSKTVVPK